jgi:hypothetical protein
VFLNNLTDVIMEKELVDCTIANDLTIGLKDLCSQVQLNGTIVRKGVRDGEWKKRISFLRKVTEESV